MRPPEWPAFPAARRSTSFYQAAPSSAIEAARVERAGAGAHAQCGRRQRRLPAAARRPPGGRDATSSATARSAPSRCRSRRSAARCSTAWLGRRGRDHQAHARPRPRAGRQPQELPVVDGRARRSSTVDLEPFERLASRADGDDRARRLHGVGSGPAGEPVADRHPRHHPRADRLRRFPDERRYRDGSARGRFRQRAAGVRRGRLRRRAPLRRQDGRRWSRSPRPSRRCPHEARGAAGPRDGADLHARTTASISRRRSRSATRCSRWPESRLIHRSLAFSLRRPGTWVSLAAWGWMRSMSRPAPKS